MSSVLDVTEISVDGAPAFVGSANVENVTITSAMDIPSVEIAMVEAVPTVAVEVPGTQGPPGLQNVYTGLTDPSTIPGEEWGIEQKGYIWIEVDV